MQHNGWTNYETWHMFTNLFLCIPVPAVCTAANCEAIAWEHIDRKVKGPGVAFVLDYMSPINWIEIALALATGGYDEDGNRVIPVIPQS
jgi:hypothetical protein